MNLTKYQARQQEREQRREENAAALKRDKGKTQSVRMETSLAGRPRCRPGDNVDLPIHEAARFIEKGLAQEVTA